MTKRVLALVLALVMAMACLSLVSAEEETKTVKYLTSTKSYDMNTDIEASILEGLTGYKVQYDYYSDEKQLALIISSGTDYDLINCSPTMYQTFLAQGALKDIKPFIEEYYPEILDEISPLGWIYVDHDGGYYGIPNVEDAVYTGGIGYRTDIFDQYGYEEPATIDEFRNLLAAIKEDTGLIPLTGKSAVEAVIASAFGLSYDLVVDSETDSIISWLRQDGMKEYLAWMADAYAEGLIDIDWPVNKDSDVNEKMSSGAAVMTYAAHWSTLNWVNALVDGGNADAYFKSIVPLEDANGNRHIACSNGVSQLFVIPVTASDEDVINTLGLVAARLEPSNYWAFNDGQEGVHYTLDETGIPTPILPIFNDEMGKGSDYQIGRNQHEHPITWMARVHKTQVQWDTFFDANSKAAAFGFEGKPMTFASFPEYTQYSSALSTMCNDYFISVIAGTESLDTYDAFVAEWEAAGGLAMEEAANEWYHANPELVHSAMVSTSPYADIFGYTIQ